MRKPPGDLHETGEEPTRPAIFDLVHYSGHADLSNEYPDRSGWLFKGGEFLTPGELESLERPPAIVVANASASSVLSCNPAIVPGLADAFFKPGVYT